MGKVLILVEGQTEETFIRDVLSPYLHEKGIYPSAKLITTKHVKSGPNFKGGCNSYDKVRNDLNLLLQDTSATIVTTMIDYYALPDNFPGFATCPNGSCFERVKYLEDQFKIDISDKRFYPYFQIHEFEALIFSFPEKIITAFPGEKQQLDRLQETIRSFSSPEEINNNPQTAPSKRLKKYFPAYEKVAHWFLITSRIELDMIRGKCKHFDEWVRFIEENG
jgi:hypothetical protein